MPAIIPIVFIVVSAILLIVLIIGCVIDKNKKQIAIGLVICVSIFAVLFGWTKISYDNLSISPARTYDIYTIENRQIIVTEDNSYNLTKIFGRTFSLLDSKANVYISSSWSYGIDWSSNPVCIEIVEDGKIICPKTRVLHPEN